MKLNVFDKPDVQSRTCSGYAEARKRAMQLNVFDKPDEQSRTYSGYAETRKRAKKIERLRFRTFVPGAALRPALFPQF